MAGLNLKLIIPVGRLAVDAFYDSSKTLDEIIGTQMEYASAQVIPLPQWDFSLVSNTVILSLDLSSIGAFSLGWSTKTK